MAPQQTQHNQAPQPGRKDVQGRINVGIANALQRYEANGATFADIRADIEHQMPAAIDRYASAYTQRSDRVIGAGTKAELRNAAVALHVRSGVLGAIAAKEIFDATPGTDAEKREAVREESMKTFADESAGIQVQGAPGTAPTTFVGEAVRIGRAIEAKRIERANEHTEKQSRRRFGRVFNNLALKYGNLSTGKKILYGAGAAVAVAAVGSATAALLPAAGVGLVGAGLSGARATIFANLNRRNEQGTMAVQAKNQQLKMLTKMRDKQDTLHTPVSSAEMAETMFHNAGHRIGKNRVLTLGSSALGFIGFHYGGDIVRHGWDAVVGHGASQAHGAAHAAASPSGSPHPTPDHQPASGKATPHPSPSPDRGPSSPGSASPSPHPTPDQQPSSGQPNPLLHPEQHPGSGTVPHLPISPEAGATPPHTVLDHLGAHQTGEIQRTWVTTDGNANVMTHFEPTHGGLKVVLEHLQHNQAALKGDHIKVAVTMSTPEGDKIIFVPMNHGDVIIKGALGKELEHGTFKYAEIVRQSVHHGVVDPHKMDVFSTVVGTNQEVSNHAFEHMLHSADVTSAHHTAVIPPVPIEHGVPVSAEVAKYEAHLYEAYANAHGGNTLANQKAFEAAMAAGLKHGQFEFTTANPHDMVGVIAPDSHYANAIWQHESAKRLLETINGDVKHPNSIGSYVPSSAEVTKYSDQVYALYAQAHGSGAVSRNTFDAALGKVLEAHKLEVLVDSKGGFSALEATPSGVWEHVPPHVALHLLEEEIKTTSGSPSPIPSPSVTIPHPVH